jgi:hypothetical protein
MPSITTWTRLEPRPRDPSLRESVQAQVRDPLWLLARQWQLAEFRGENAGSPVKVELSYQTARVNNYVPPPDLNNLANPVPKPYDPAEQPLETLVEAEAPALGGRQRVESGLAFLRLLSDKLFKSYSTLFTDPANGLTLEKPSGTLDPGSEAFYSLMANRAMDGSKLRVRLPQDPETPIDWQNAPPVMGVDEAHRNEMGDALRNWASGYDKEFPPTPATAWDPARLEYRFAVTAPATEENGTVTTIRLSAAEYAGGRLDWHVFDIEAGASSKNISQPVPLTTRPVGIQFPGMPAARFWTFEPGVIDFGALETASTDLARLLFAEFALVYGNDFFLIPIELEIGSLTCIESLMVTDTFGQQHKIRPASQVDRGLNGPNGRAPWRLFSLSSEQSGAEAEDFLFLAPALVGDLHGRPLEEVTMLRDEMANCVWAIENRVVGQNGRPYERAEAYQMEQQQLRDQQEADEPGSTSPGDGPLTYRLFTAVPDYWHPLLPRRSTASGPVRLQLRTGGTIYGSLLAPYQASATSIYEEEVPRIGLSVRREPQLARWVDGRTFAWTGRRKKWGPGEGASGLKFDDLTAGDKQ